MKKSLTIMMVSVIFMFICMTGIHAEDITTNGSTEVTVTKTVPSTYKVTIPKQIDLGNETRTQVYIKAEGNIAPTEKLSVSAPSEIEMKKQGDDKYTGKAVFNFGTSYYETYALASGVQSSGSIVFDETNAGVYTGTLTFDISLDAIN